MTPCAVPGCPALARVGEDRCAIHRPVAIFRCASCGADLPAFSVIATQGTEDKPPMLQHQDGRNRPCGPVVRR